MPVTPIQRLAKALCDATSGGKPEAVVAFARQWGIDGRIARRAARGIDTNASDYLRLCAAVGIDPILPIEAEPKRLDPLNWELVSIKVRATLIGSPGEPNITMRKLASVWKLPLVSLARMKAGQPVNIDNLLKLCRALRCHPHMFVKRSPPPPMFHSEQEVEQPERASA